jgi:hypothetical protein
MRMSRASSSALWRRGTAASTARLCLTNYLP